MSFFFKETHRMKKVKLCMMYASLRMPNLDMEDKDQVLKESNPCKTNKKKSRNNKSALLNSH